VCRLINWIMGKEKETEAEVLLKDAIHKARQTVSDVSDAFNCEWSRNPSTSVRAVLGYWMFTAIRHFVALITLCEENDLSMVSGTHYRQMLEIMIQVRYFTSQAISQWETMAQRVSAYGCIEYLEKLKIVKDHPSVVEGYMEAQEQLKRYDQQIVDQIRRARSNKEWYWFGKSFSAVAKKLSSSSENLQALYQLHSADMHGSWGLTFGVANPKPGSLDFRGYPDKATMYKWAADSVDLATQMLKRIWNDIARAVGAPTVE